MAVAALAEIGHNQPPPTAYEACKAHMDDLLTEARNWADGAGVENQAQADEISRLIEDLRMAADAADKARVEEKRPFDDMADEVQARFNVYIAPLKNKVPGKIPVAMDALKATLKPYLDAEKAKLDAIAEEARRVAQEAADKAAEAMRASDATNLEARESAEALVEAARLAGTAASRAGNDKAQARGGSRALGLKTYYEPEMTDPKAALVHYMTARPDEIKACLLRLAEADVREGKRAIAGFTIHERTRL